MKQEHNLWIVIAILVFLVGSYILFTQFLLNQKIQNASKLQYIELRLSRIEKQLDTIKRR